MKIIDESKLFGNPIIINNYQLTRMIIYKKIKKISGSEKIFLIESRNNKFKNKPKRSLEIDDNIKKFIEIKKSIINSKIKNKTIEIVKIAVDSKIKRLGMIANSITFIDSIDPRFIILWNYNPNIIIKIYFNEKSIGEYDLESFVSEFPKFDIKSRSDWSKLLFLYGTISTSKLNRLGVVGFKKYLNLGFDINEIAEKYNFSYNEANKRKKVVESLLQEIA